MATNNNEDGANYFVIGIIVSIICIILNLVVVYYARKKINFIMDPVLNESRRKNILTMVLYKTIIAQSIVLLVYNAFWNIGIIMIHV